MDVNLFTHHRNDLVIFFRSTECKKTLELKRIEFFTPINKGKVITTLIMNHIGVGSQTPEGARNVSNYVMICTLLHPRRIEPSSAPLWERQNPAYSQPVWFVNPWALLSFRSYRHKLLLPEWWAQTCLNSLCMQTFVTFHRFSPHVIHLSLSLSLALSKLHSRTPLRYLHFRCFVLLETKEPKCQWHSHIWSFIVLTDRRLTLLICDNIPSGLLDYYKRLTATCDLNIQGIAAANISV